MRFGDTCGAIAILGAVVVSISSVGGALAADPQVFPVQPHLVPVLVAAVFVLPAAMAGLMSGIRRRQARGALLAIGLLAIATVAVAMYADTAFLASIRV